MQNLFKDSGPSIRFLISQLVLEGNGRDLGLHVAVPRRTWKAAMLRSENADPANACSTLCFDEIRSPKGRQMS